MPLLLLQNQVQYSWKHQVPSSYFTCISIFPDVSGISFEILAWISGYISSSMCNVPLVEISSETGLQFNVV
jgi:hypothetical protein